MIVGVVSGATFLWLMPPFVGCGGAIPSVVCGSQVALCVATIAAFLVASWTLARDDPRWAYAAQVASVLGLLSTGLYAVISDALPVNAAHQVVLHVALALLALVAATVPRLRGAIERTDRGS